METKIKPFQTLVHLCRVCHKQKRTDTKNKLKIHCHDKIEPAGNSLNGPHRPRPATKLGKRCAPA